MLGIKADNHLSWKDELDIVAGTLDSEIGLFLRIKDYLPKETRITYYTTFQQPHMDHCITGWCQSDHIIHTQK